jgi:superfamily II DNA or RNA helicase
LTPRRGARFPPVMPTPTVDSPGAAESLRRYLDGFDPLSRARGEAYLRGGRVLSVVRLSDTILRAEVLGSRRYTVELTRNGEGWTDTCTCPLASGCKHSAAAALRWLQQIDPSVGGLVAPRGTGHFRQHWEPILAQKLGRALTAEEGALLGRISQVFHSFRQNGVVQAQELSRLGFATTESARGFYHPAMVGWWAEPPADPMEFWQYIAYDLESSGLTVPEFLRPVTDTRAIRRHLDGRQRREAIARWKERLGHVLPVGASPREGHVAGHVLEPLEIRVRIGADTLVVESRPGPEATWRNAWQDLSKRFSFENSAALAALDVTPAVFALLALFQQNFRYAAGTALRPGEPRVRTWLHALLMHPLARSLVTTPAGAPVAFSPDPLRWQLQGTAGHDQEYRLGLRLPDGQPLPPDTLYLPGDPNCYLHRGTVYAGPPALDGNSAAAALVPAEVIEEPEIVARLQQGGAVLPSDLAARIVTVPLGARLDCLLETNPAGQEVLLVSLHAVSREPPYEKEWTAAGLAYGDALNPTPTTDVAGRILTFDDRVPTETARRLSEFRLYYSPPQECWVRRITRSFPEEFLAWREALPPEVEVRASGELASLLGAPVRASVDFSLLESATHRDWFDLALALKPEDSTLTPEEIALLLRARGKLVRLPGKGWRRLTVHLDEATAEALAAAGFEPLSIAEAALAGEKHRFHALQLAQSKLADRLPERHAAELRARARSLAQPAAALPATLTAELRPYQREGFQFLTFLAANRLGGVLADDMGLGKTVQTLAWLLWLAERQPAGEPLRALVVCPKSVVGNWETETARFAAAIATARYAPGAAPDTAGPGEDAARPRLVIANYTQLRLGAEYFTGRRWHAVILDEGQFIKTPSSRVAQVARDVPGEHRLVLTGTPIENRLLDLWSLFAFALPGLLGPQAAFKRHYDAENPLALPRLRARVRHFLLRRTKGQVAADLPARTEEDVVVELEGEQAKLYQAELKRARAQLLKVSTDRQLDRLRFHILASLLRLRQICCHPALVDSAHRAAPSAKLDELLERLADLRDEGHQVLVFSQFVAMLELIRERIAAAGFEYLMLTGQTEDRDALVRQFQSDRRHTVFLLSLKAAGFGLNLTAASYVILCDPWWNPAVEAQAIDRTHRIGQNAPVIAYRLIARGTIEEKIRRLQHEKAALAHAVVQEESLASVLDLDSLRQILG